MKLDAMRLEVENHEASDFENWAIVDADSDNGDVVALVPKTDDVERPELAIANLFAAAPELLAALNRALPWIGRLIADGGHLNSVAPNDAIGAMNQAQAAIDRATGHE